MIYSEMRLESKQDLTIPEDLIDFLHNGSPPVYVGFGSMSDRDPQATMEIVLAALAKTNQRGIIATGWGGIDDFNLPSSVFKIDSIPHDWLFPQCAAVVHHGGAGTTAAGIKAGVPSIIVPFFSDQPFWGYRIFDLGVGTEPILQSQLTIDKLTAAINQAVKDEQMQTSAQRVENQIRYLEKFLRYYAIIKVNESISEKAIELLSLYRLSHGLLIPDGLIGATTIVVNAPLLSKNQKDYRFISELNLLSYP